MILSCPACGTRYRHRSGESAATRAQCSRCDEQFPLRPAARAYVLRERQAGERPAAAPSRLAIGRDDPTLDARLRRTALDAGAERRPAALTYRVVPEEPAERIAPATVAADVPAPPAPRGVRARASALQQALAVALLSTGGAVSAYHLSAMQQEPRVLAWSAGGGVAGLVVGWALVRWMGGKH
jgi:hypothetical protein